MIRVDIEIHPGGDPTRLWRVARVEVANISSDGAEVADYVIKVDDKPAGIVFQHPRSMGIGSLLARVFARSEVQDAINR